MKPLVSLRAFAVSAALAFAVAAPFVSAADSPAANAADARFQIPATDDGLPGAGPIRRYDWFKKLWTERRSAWSKRVQQDQGALVFLGDSITQGWGDDFSARFPGVKIANRGISGDTTRGILVRLQEDVLSLHPSGVVLLIGTNDLEEAADPEVITSNLKLILAALKQHDAKMPIVLCQVFPSSESKKRPVAQIKKINELYTAAITGDTQVTLVQTWALFADAQGDAKIDEFPDLLHPNAAGYAKWVAALRPIFETIGFIAAEPDTFVPEPGFVSLFNGRDLTGWVTSGENLDGKVSSPDGAYIAKNGRLIVTTPRAARRLGRVSTTREFPKDFVLKLEFRASANADSGIYIRQPQLQCRDYLIAGPYKTLTRYKPQEWNEIVVTVKDGVANCTCNGEVLEAALKVPPTGPIGLESDRAQMEYRRIRIQETP